MEGLGIILISVIAYCYWKDRKKKNKTRQYPKAEVEFSSRNFDELEDEVSEENEDFDLQDISPEIPENEKPTERQVRYAKDLGIKIPKNVTKNELSDLISNKIDDDPCSSSYLRSTASYFNVQYTRYTGRDTLYGRIHGLLSQPGRERELVTWFAYWVYRRLINYRDTGVEIDDYRILEIADELVNDPRTLKSIRRHDGIDFAGEREFSTRTIAYQEVSERIREKFGIPKPDTTRKPKTAKDPAGCLVSFFLLAVISFLFVSVIVWAGKYVFG